MVLIKGCPRAPQKKEIFERLSFRYFGWFGLIFGWYCLGDLEIEMGDWKSDEKFERLIIGGDSFFGDLRSPLQKIARVGHPLGSQALPGRAWTFGDLRSPLQKIARVGHPLGFQALPGRAGTFGDLRSPLQKAIQRWTTGLRPYRSMRMATPSATSGRRSKKQFRV